MPDEPFGAKKVLQDKTCANSGIFFINIYQFSVFFLVRSKTGGMRPCIISKYVVNHVFSEMLSSRAMYSFE